MTTIHLPMAPVGVAICPARPGWAEGASAFQGFSFCRAVAEATGGAVLWVAPDAIDTCNWSPVVLGLRQDDSAFAAQIEPRLPAGTGGLVVARLDRFPAESPPDVVITRAPQETLTQMADRAGWERAAWSQVEERRLAKSALGRLRDPKPNWRAGLLRPVNRTLATMDRLPGWRRMTLVAFRARSVSSAFEQLIKRALASMSICRNSVVIPHVTGQFNVSYFCTGGIAWGGNYPFHMTAGWPWAIWREIAPTINW